MSKTHEQFVEELKIKQPILFNQIKIAENYKPNNKLLVETKYGKCITFPSNLLLGQTPSIKTAINKSEYFKNELSYLHPNLYNDITILDNYIHNQLPIIVENKYGKCKITPNSLLLGQYPSIRSAINKTEYFINRAREVHGDLYDYSLVDYTKDSVKVKIISEYGIFEQTPGNHLSGKGCPKIANTLNNFKDGDWEKNGKRSKNFDSFKVYIIHCWNDNETFYKIGKTYLTVKQRFIGKRAMPYNYEIIKEITNTAYKTCQLERDLHKKCIQFSYNPLIKFGGIKECFSEILI